MTGKNSIGKQGLGEGEDCPCVNEYLKTAFIRFHDKIVSGINVSSVVDQLLAVGVISTDDYGMLCHTGLMASPVEQCRRLMSILYASGNPEVFIQLRQALLKEVAHRWLVDMVDEHYNRIMSSSLSQTSENVSLMRQPSASNAWQSISGSRYGFVETPTILIQLQDSVWRLPSNNRSTDITDDSGGSASEGGYIPLELSYDVTYGGIQTLPAPVLTVSPPSPTAQSPTSPLSAADSILRYKSKALQMAVLRPDARGHVSGVAELGGQLFIIADSSDTIYVFYPTSTLGEPFAERERFRAKGLRRASDIAACSHTCRLYIADAGERCVWLISSMAVMTARIRRKKNVLSECWLRTPEFEPSSLSCRLQRLVVTPLVGTSLYVYESNGKLLRRIPLPKNTKASHAVETDRDTFVVSLIDSARVQISEIDVAGSILRVYDNQRCNCQAHHHLEELRYLTLDRNGRVLVADNDRVLLLSADLNPERVLLSDRVDDLELKPNRLCLIENAAQLVVSDRTCNCVYVYRVRPK